MWYIFYRSLYGEKWFYEECKSKRDNHPPLCATFGEWIRPKDRSREELTRCTVLGCGLGHLTLPRIKEAVGIELLKRTFTVIMLRFLSHMCCWRHFLLKYKYKFTVCDLFHI